MMPVRRLLSILLLVLFVLPMACSLFAAGSTAAANVPACCRRDGKHHCLMSMALQRSSPQQGSAFTATPERCPYCPGVVSPAHVDTLAVSTGEAIFAGLASHPAGGAQTESKRRVSRDRSRGKRGPPPVLFS